MLMWQRSQFILGASRQASLEDTTTVNMRQTLTGAGFCLCSPQGEQYFLPWIYVKGPIRAAVMSSIIIVRV